MPRRIARIARIVTAGDEPPPYSLHSAGTTEKVEQGGGGCACTWAEPVAVVACLWQFDVILGTGMTYFEDYGWP